MVLTVKDLEVGKTYKHLSGDLDDGVTLTSDTFEVSYIDPDGDIWTINSIYDDKVLDDGGGWCVFASDGDATFELVI